MSISKKLNKYLEDEILAETPEFTKENMLAKIEFGEGRKPSKRKWINFFLKIAYSLALIVITAILSITIYTYTSDFYDDDDNIIFEVREIFNKELEDYPKAKLEYLMNPNQKSVVGIYSYNNYEGYKLMCYFKMKNYNSVVLLFNNQEYIIDTQIEMYDIVLEEENEISLIINEDVVFYTTFDKN